MRLRIAIPSRERPERLEKTLCSILKTINDENNNISVIILTDYDDPETDKYNSVAKHYSMLEGIYFQNGNTGKYIRLINDIYTNNNTDFDAFMCGTDDIIFEDKGWFEELEKINEKNKYWVAWFSDGEKEQECAQVPVLSKAVIDVLGTPLYPKLGHFYGDMWITLLAKYCEIAHYIPTHKIIHMTPKNGRVKEMDSTFIRVRKNEQILKDHKIFSDSSADLSEAANKLKEAMKNG